ncbi:hypothetical protein [Paraglaciecola hydrolytica]|uniref:Antitoxin Xre/MbcA/ParS-like toxin-binding domain-containing protein n=1 Tax=Paraglaciecola hydrolytica TaxID=1799789 RepID=A0A135ZZL3_9ALTE|nr:hypothetical protein [Paraglaciecola hydrolytica]KXI28383.1 hypothetical protein AX660_18655 [Paraglaciecola hydrolytica]
MGKVLDIMNLTDKNGDIDVGRILDLLKCNETELAQSLGICNLVHSTASLRIALQNKLFYQQLLQVICIVNFVQEMGSTRREAFLWFYEEQIPAFGGVTAKECVQNHQFEYVMDYLQSIKLGGYA